MIKKLISMFLMAVIIVCSLSACGDGDDISLIMPINSDPLCLDPQIAETDEAKLIISNCYEGLVRLDENHKIINGAAESYSVSEDGLTYTFKIRENTNWQLLKAYSTVLEDENYMENFNTQVTAYDFQFALRRAVDPITNSPDAEKLYCIKNAKAIHSGSAGKNSLGVKATDAFTLTITLERANPDFLRILTLPLCMPCNEEFFNATHAKYGLELKYTFCNGPFYLGRWTENNSLIVYKNEGYIGALDVKPTAVYFNVNSDEESVNTKLKQLSYNAAIISDASYNSLSGNNKVHFSISENSVKGLVFNCSDSILSNADLRKALVMLTDTSKIDKPDGALNTATGIIPECCRFAESSYRDAAGKVNALTYNEQEALKLWEKGLEDLEIQSAGIKIICTEEYSAQMQKAIQSWQKVLTTSIVAKVEVLNESDLEAAVKSDSYQIAVTEIKAESSTATDMLRIFTTENRDNIFNYSDEAFDRMTDNIISNASGNGILNSVKAAEQHLISNAVFCPLFTYGDYLAINKDTFGISPYPAFEGISFISGGVD